MDGQYTNVIWLVGIHTCIVWVFITLTSAQIYVSNDMSVDSTTGRLSRSIDDSSFIESNQLPRYHKRELQLELLHLLGLKQRPRPAALRGGQNHSAPQFMLDLYNSLSTSIELGNDHYDEGDEEAADVYSGYHRDVLSSIMRMGNFNYTTSEIRAVDDADTIMSLPVHYRSQSLERHGPHRYHFGATSVPAAHDILTSAELRVYRDNPPDEYRGGIFKVKVYQISGDGGHIFMDSVIIDSSDVGWIVFDVTYASRMLQSYPGARLSIQLIAEDEQRTEISPDLVGLRGIGEDELLEPFMVAFFKTHEEMREEQLSRVRRSRRPKKSKKGKGRGGISVMPTDPMQSGLYNDVSVSRKPNRECRRRSLHVNFRELDWNNWIIAPDGYHAYSCQGECSFPLHGKLNATNHAIVQTLVHILNPSIVPKACCAPTKLGPIEVLYFDDSTNVILRKYKNMVVRACGCH